METIDVEPAVRTRGALSALCPECEQTVMIRTVQEAPTLMQHPNYGRTSLRAAVCAGTGRPVVSL